MVRMIWQDMTMQRTGLKVPDPFERRMKYQFPISKQMRIEKETLFHQQKEMVFIDLD